MKRGLLFFAVCLIAAVSVFGQTAAELEQLLAAEAVSYEQAARFVLKAADVSDLSPQAAFGYAVDQKWLPAGVKGAANAKLNAVSLLVMQAFGFKGGIFYSLTKNPHYAYRELVYQGIIQGKTDPAMTVSGDFLLFTVGRALSRVENVSYPEGL
jgi:hypothetical protein